MTHTTIRLILVGVVSSLAAACGSSATQAAQTTVRPPAADDSRPAPIAQNEERTPDPSECNLDAVYYAFDSSDLDDSARSTLSNNVRCLEAKNAASVNVVGMADARGTEEYNLALGDRRARSAVQYLRSLGVEDGRLRMTSVGEEYASGTDESSMARDRRSDIQAQ
jgi:peptidoglycan-associated lipoprotein